MFTHKNLAEHRLCLVGHPRSLYGENFFLWSEQREIEHEANNIHPVVVVPEQNQRRTRASERGEKVDTP